MSCHYYCDWNCGGTDCPAPEYYAELDKFSEAITLIKLQPFYR